ncbi:MAG: flagellar FliJ family protein [Alphaproteobacteria bacterium]|nr:flagellar FliJ family protein [Alphaproteobacteria bacterium]
MTDLNPLIRLRKYRVEEKQKALAELFRQTELLEGRKRVLLSEIEREEVLANKANSIDAMFSFVAYAARVNTEIEKLNKLIEMMEPRILKAQDEMREAFSEQKKAEIIQAQREAEEAKNIAKKENTNLDEIGGEVFRRKDQDRL